MTENKEPDSYRIDIKNGNYNESIGRDYVEGNVYHNCNINVSQETSVSNLEKQQSISRNIESQSTINSSGSWVLIKDYFFRATEVCTYRDNTITVKILSESPEEDANIRSLRLEYFRQSDIISFAYRNDGFLVRLEGIEEEFKEGICIWSLTLKPEDIKYGGDVMECTYKGHQKTYSTVDIAELRGRRILLNNPPKSSKKNIHNHHYLLSDEAMLESLISSPYGKDFKVDNCILQELYPQFKDQPKKFLELSRLAAIFYLKAGDVVEQVLELSLELIEINKVHVKFRGKRRKIYSNVEPAIIEIEGECLL